jgi:WD40 repeat protein
VVAASPTTHEVAAFGYDKVPRIFDGDTCELLGGLEPLGDAGYGMAYSPDGTVLAVGGGYQVNLYDAGDGSVLDRNTVNAYVYKTVWYGNTDIAVVGQNSSRIDVITLEDNSTQQLTTPENVILWSVAFSPDQTLLVTGNANGGVRVIDIGTAEVVFSTQTKGAVLDLEFSPDGSRMAACNGSGHVYVWDTNSWDITLSSEISGAPVHAGGCQDGAFGGDGSVYMTAGADGYLNMFDSNEGTLLNYFWYEGLPTLESVSVTGDGELVVVGISTPGSVGIFALP